MKNGLRRIRGAVLMGLAWAAVWGPIAVLASLVIDPDGSMDEMWVAAGAYPGFLSAVVLSVLLATAGRGRALAELPLGRAAAWGAVAGLLVGTIPFLIGDPTDRVPAWVLAGIVIGSITLLSTLSAVATAMVLRHAGRRHAPTGAQPRSA